MRRIACGLVVLVYFGIAAGAEDSINQDRWYFDLDVYVWLPTIEGKLNYDIPGSGDSLQVDPATIIEDLQMTGMLGFSAHRDRWSAFTDVIYLDMADSKESSVPLSIGPGPGLDLDVGAGLELKGLIVEVAGAYDVVRTDNAALGVLVGLRYFSMDTELAIKVDGPLPPELPTENYSQTGELWNGIVGIKGHYGSRWYVPYYFDVGTGTSELTWQAMAGFGYRWHWGSVFVTYRYLSFDEGEEEFVHELNFGGPAVGVNFRF